MVLPFTGDRRGDMHFMVSPGRFALSSSGGRRDYPTPRRYRRCYPASHIAGPETNAADRLIRRFRPPDGTRPIPPEADFSGSHPRSYPASAALHQIFLIKLRLPASLSDQFQ